MHQLKVIIIILQYNNFQDSIRCLESVKELNYPDFRVILVDNASEVKHLNNARYFIENQEESGFKNFKLIESQKNLGYAGGNNIGIKYALENGADYVLILNPDTKVGKDLLTKLISQAGSDERIGIVGPAIDEGNKIVYGGKIRWLKPELKHLTSPAQRNVNFFVSGAAMLIKKEVFQKIGMLDERYFLYFEDADYCMRARKAGYSLAMVPDTIVSHQVSATTHKLGAAKLLYYHYRNAHLFNLKNAPLPAKIALPFWSFFVIIKQLLKMVFAPSKREISHLILKGVADFYLGKFGRLI